MARELLVRVSSRTVLLTLLTLLSVWMMLNLYRVLVLLFVSVLLAVAISGMVDRFERWGVPRAASILGIYMVLLLALVGLGFVLVPLVTHQVDLLRVQFPNLVREPLRQGSEAIAAQFPSLRESLPTGDVASQMAQHVGSLFGDVVGGALLVGRALMGFILNLVVVLVITFFLVSRSAVAVRFINLMVPARFRPRLIKVTGVIGRRLGRWVWAQMIIATFYALCFGLGLAVLNVPYAIALAVIGGLLELIPYVGGFIATILTMIVAFTVEPTLALWVLGLHLVVGNIEVHIIAPKVMGHAVETHPVIAILALFSGIELLGIIGALIAIPLTVVTQSLVEEFWISKINPPPADDPAASGPPLQAPRTGRRWRVRQGRPAAAASTPMATREPPA